MNICRTWNLKLALQFMKESGLQLVACTEKTQDSMYKPDYSSPTAVIMGSEEDGVSPELLKMCDARAKIPMNGKITSLNVSVATGVILYELIRQRKKHEH
jgi:23S rRNA (guanosine2251-2'-O)-methyltransferase